VYKDGTNPVARTNVCPEYDPPAEPSLHAFCYTEPARAAGGSFIVAGSGEAPEGKGNYRDHVIAPNDVSPEGLRKKMRYVLGEMQRRLEALGFGWKDTGSTQAYTVRDIGALTQPEIFARGCAPNGLAWHFCRPPVAGLDYEMDVRGAAQELLL
jgi:hypothetical protein